MGASSKPKKTVEEKGYNKFESKELSKNYFDSNPLKLTKGEITLKQLRYGTIVSHKLEAVKIELDTIELKSGWIEFILIMLYKLMDDNKSDTFKTIIGKNHLTNQDLHIEKIYGNYSFSNTPYSIYKIYDTGYFLEIRELPRVIFTAIVKLLYILEVNPKAVRFVVESYNATKEELMEDKLNYKTGVFALDKALENFENNRHLAYIKINDTLEEVHRIEVALLMFCNIVYDTYGLSKMMSIKNTVGTGLTLNEAYTEHPCEKIKNSNLFVYTNSDIKDIIRFISNTVDVTKVKVEFGFRIESAVKHEWETD